MTADPQPSDPSPPAPAPDDPSDVAPGDQPIEAVLPTRTPGDAADVFFQPRLVDGPAVDKAAEAAVPVGQDLTDRFGDDWPVGFAFNHHQVSGSGEDSDPVLRTGRDVGLLAVFDGMGGAGGTVYETPDGQRSGAYLASRVARDVAEECLVDWMNAGAGDGEQVAERLQQSVQQALQARLVELKAPTSRLRSKLLRALPTTMAMVAVQRLSAAEGTWSCDLLWAGDSRVYALDGQGLHQLTVDDIRDHGDAMANLHEDSVVSNAMSADTPYLVNHRYLELTEPVALVAATDGCFGYLPSPMHFEELLLSTLHGAETVSQWSDAVRAAIVAVAGDDASMAFGAVGADLEALEDLTADRWHTVRQEWVGPLDAASAEVDRLAAELDSATLAQAELSAALWAAYEGDYSRHLPTATSKDGLS